MFSIDEKKKKNKENKFAFMQMVSYELKFVGANIDKFCGCYNFVGAN